MKKNYTHSSILVFTPIIIGMFLISPGHAQTWGSIQTIDATANVGLYSSLSIVNGNPAISYYDGGADFDLKYVRANDANGTSWSSPQIIDAAGNVGRYTSLSLVNGNPAVSYYDVTNKDLKYVRASDASGTGWNSPLTIDATGNVGLYTSLITVNGNPAIAYYEDGANKDLKYVRASDANGTAWNSPVIIDATGSVGFYPSLSIVNGNPAISYYDNTNGDLKYVRASNTSGTAWGSPQTISSTGIVGEYTSLTIVNGYPAISYYDNTNGDLKYIRATDANGTAWDSPQTVDGSGNVGLYTSLSIVNGNPAISYHDSTNGNLKYVRSTDASGTAWGSPTILASTGITGQYTTMKTLSNNGTGIAFYDATEKWPLFISGCTAPSVPVLSATATVMCTGNSSTLSISSGSLNNATDWKWYSGSCGGASAGNGTSITVSPTSTTIYYARGEGGCVSPGICGSITITVNPLPLVSLGSDVTQCGGPLILDAGNSGSTYVWSTNETTQAISVTSTGSYSVVVTDVNSCSNFDMTSITILSTPSVVMSKTDATCTTNNGKATATPSGGILPYTYAWNTGATTQTISNLASASYTCLVYGNNGCAKTGTVSVGAIACGPAKLQPAYCGITLNTINQYVYCVQVAGATNYHYRVTAAGFSGNYYRQSSYTDFQITRISGIQYNKTYSIEVRALISNVWSTWGQVCTLTTPALVPTPQLNGCPIVLNALDQTLSITGVAGATNYQYKVTHTASGFTGYYTRNLNFSDFQMTRVAGVQYGKTYTVEVRAYVGGVWGNYGTTCSVTTPATIPLTEIRPADCGATLAAVSTPIYCNSVPGASNYQYKVENTPSGFSKIYTRNSNLTNFQLSWLTGIKVSTTYNIIVRSYVSGVWSSYGDTCQVTTGPVMRLESEDENINFSMNVYPNPIEDDVLHYNLVGVQADQKATIEVYDMVGTKIYSEKIIHQPGTDGAIQIDDKFSKGVYFLHIIINSSRYYQKFVVIK